MKKCLFSMIAAMLLVGFSSCSEDLTPATQSNKAVQMTVYASRGDINTRTILNEVGGSLTCAWEKGDQLLVTNSAGGKLGVLNLTDVKSGKFDGSLVGVSGDKMTLNYFYLGHGTELEKVGSDYTLKIASQLGTLKDCGNKDLLSAQKEVAIIGDKAYVEGTLTLKRHISFAHFKLNFPTGVSMANGKVTISGANVITQATFGLGNRQLSNLTAGEITVSDTNGDFYLCLIPTTGVTPTFTVTINNVKYQGSLAARSWTEGEFVRNGNKEGVPVKMEEDAAIKFVDLGLPSGTLWADRNLGATAPEEAGGYYQYGALQPLSPSAYDNSETDYRMWNYHYEDIKGTLNLGYVYDTGYNMYGEFVYKAPYDWTTIEGDAKCDAVTANLGSKCHLPNPDNFDELVSKCTWNAETIKGISGYRVTGTNGNSIFIPQCGALGNQQNLLEASKGTGYYWLSWIDMEVNRGIATQIGANFKSAETKAGPLDFNQFYLQIRGVKDK